MDDLGPNFRDYSGVAYSDVTDSIFIVDNRNNLGAPHNHNHIIEYTVDGLSGSFIEMDGFVDVESIIHLDGDRFAVVEEREQVGRPGEFDITIIEIDGLGGEIVKSEAEKTITVSDDPDLNDGEDNNKGLESLAYDPVDGHFYFAKEKGFVEIYRVHEDTEVLEEVNIPGVTSTDTGILGDISDIHFVRTPDAPYGRLILLSDDSAKIIMADVAADGTTWHVVVDGNENPIELSLPTDYEGIGFTPGGFFMWTVLDGDANTMRWYRNFTSLTPAAAPDLTDATDTGINNDNLTTETTLSFSGTLSRGIFEDTVPVEDAWVWLYVDDGSTVELATDSSVEVASDGSYTITADDIENAGSYAFTIKASAGETTAEADRSFASEATCVTIHSHDVLGDLTGNSAVDFEDLTILLANWNMSGKTWAEGNIAQACDSPSIVNFNDLTLLLAAWNGAPPAAAPQLAWAAPSVEHDSEAVYSTSTVFKVQFNLPVTGVDVTDLVLTGTGGSGATVDSVTDYAMLNIYGFHVSGLSIGTVDVDLAPDEDDITYVTGGAWIGLKEWTFIALPGVSFTAGALDIDGSSGDDTLTGRSIAMYALSV